MTIVICICDYWQKREYLQIESGNNIVQLLDKPSKDQLKPANEHKQIHLKKDPRTFRRLRLAIDGITAFYLLREVTQSQEFRTRLLENPALRQMQLLWLQVEPPAKDIIDYKWNNMLAHSLWEKIEVDYMMSWLSTLGGGYSALGEQFSRCAETAGKISLKQLNIGLRLGDPFLQSRCKLYYSISLIQTGQLKAAKHIVREQYKFAIKQKEIDGRLVKMCEGIWMRIQYEYGLLISKKKQKSNELSNNK